MAVDRILNICLLASLVNFYSTLAFPSQITDNKLHNEPTNLRKLVNALFDPFEISTQPDMIEFKEQLSNTNNPFAPKAIYKRNIKEEKGGRRKQKHQRGTKGKEKKERRNIEKNKKEDNQNCTCEVLDHERSVASSLLETFIKFLTRQGIDNVYDTNERIYDPTIRGEVGDLLGDLIKKITPFVEQTPMKKRKLSDIKYRKHPSNSKLYGRTSMDEGDVVESVTQLEGFERNDIFDSTNDDDEELQDGIVKGVSAEIDEDKHEMPQLDNDEDENGEQMDESVDFSLLSDGDKKLKGMEEDFLGASGSGLPMDDDEDSSTILDESPDVSPNVVELEDDEEKPESTKKKPTYDQEGSAILLQENERPTDPNYEDNVSQSTEDDDITKKKTPKKHLRKKPSIDPTHEDSDTLPYQIPENLFSQPEGLDDSTISMKNRKKKKFGFPPYKLPSRPLYQPTKDLLGGMNRNNRPQTPNIPDYDGLPLQAVRPMRQMPGQMKLKIKKKNNEPQLPQHKYKRPLDDIASEFNQNDIDFQYLLDRKEGSHPLTRPNYPQNTKGDMDSWNYRLPKRRQRKPKRFKKRGKFPGYLLGNPQDYMSGRPNRFRLTKNRKPNRGKKWKEASNLADSFYPNRGPSQRPDIFGFRPGKKKQKQNNRHKFNQPSYIPGFTKYSNQSLNNINANFIPNKYWQPGNEQMKLHESIPDYSEVESPESFNVNKLIESVNGFKKKPKFDKNRKRKHKKWKKLQEIDNGLAYPANQPDESEENLPIDAVTPEEEVSKPVPVNEEVFEELLNINPNKLQNISISKLLNAIPSDLLKKMKGNQKFLKLLLSILNKSQKGQRGIDSRNVLQALLSRNDKEINALIGAEGIMIGVQESDVSKTSKKINIEDEGPIKTNQSQLKDAVESLNDKEMVYENKHKHFQEFYGDSNLNKIDVGDDSELTEMTKGQQGNKTVNLAEVGDQGINNIDLDTDYELSETEKGQRESKVEITYESGLEAQEKKHKILESEDQNLDSDEYDTTEAYNASKVDITFEDTLKLKRRKKPKESNDSLEPLDVDGDSELSETNKSHSGSKVEFTYEDELEMTKRKFAGGLNPDNTDDYPKFTDAKINKQGTENKLDFVDITLGDDSEMEETMKASNGSKIEMIYQDELQVKKQKNADKSDNENDSDSIEESDKAYNAGKVEFMYDDNMQTFKRQKLRPGDRNKVNLMPNRMLKKYKRGYKNIKGTTLDEIIPDNTQSLGVINTDDDYEMSKTKKSSNRSKFEILYEDALKTQRKSKKAKKGNKPLVGSDINPAENEGIHGSDQLGVVFKRPLRKKANLELGSDDEVSQTKKASKGSKMEIMYKDEIEVKKRKTIANNYDDDDFEGDQADFDELETNTLQNGNRMEFLYEDALLVKKRKKSKPGHAMMPGYGWPRRLPKPKGDSDVDENRHILSSQTKLKGLYRNARPLIFRKKKRKITKPGAIGAFNTNTFQYRGIPDESDEYIPNIDSLSPVKPIDYTTPDNFHIYPSPLVIQGNLPFLEENEDLVDCNTTQDAPSDNDDFLNYGEFRPPRPKPKPLPNPLIQKWYHPNVKKVEKYFPGSNDLQNVMERKNIPLLNNLKSEKDNPLVFKGAKIKIIE